MKAVLHIGTHKTGTTTIQTFLAKNRDALKTQRMYISCLKRAHAQYEELFAILLNRDAWSSRSILSFVGNLCEIIFFGKEFSKNNQKKLWEEFCCEIKANCQMDDLVFMSCEDLSLLTGYEIAELKKLLESLFDDVTIVLYLRRQPEYLVSFYNTLVSLGMTQNFREYRDQPEGHSILDYHQLVKRWSVFGKDKLKIRLFDKQEFHDNDLLSDFAQTVGFEMTGLQRVSDIYPSLDSASTEFLLLLNSCCPVIDEDQNIDHDRFPQLGKSIYAYSRHTLNGKKQKAYYLTRNEARQILDQCREGNDWIAREYFGREKLFSDDLSMYPEEVDSPHGLTLEKCAEITASLWKERCQRIHHLEQQNQRLNVEIQRLLQRRNKRLLYRCKTALSWMKKGIRNVHKAVTHQKKRLKTRHTHETVEKN